MKTSILLTETLATLLIAAAWIKASKVWQWKLALVTQEFGHWIALATLVAACAAWVAFTGWRRLTLTGVGLVLAAAHLLPAYIAARHTDGCNWTRLWIPWLYTHDGPPPERRIFWQDGDNALDLLVYRARPMNANPGPWVMVLHGGGWNGGSADEFAAAHQELSSKGITVLTMNYRLAPQHRWPAQRDDVRNGIAWARAHAAELGIDPAQLVLMGRSAGGQIASACAYSMPELRARGVILFYSPMDMVFARKFAYAEDILNSLQLLRQYLGGDPEEAPQNYHSASAVNYISAATPPTLMIHGAPDTLVWVEQSRRLSARLREANVRCTYLELPCATHGFDYFPSTPGGQFAIAQVLSFVGSVTP